MARQSGSAHHDPGTRQARDRHPARRAPQAAGPWQERRPPADGTAGPGPGRADFVGEETAGAWGDFLRAVAADDEDRRPREQPGSREAARLRSAAVFGSRFFAEVVTAVDRLSRAGNADVTVRMVAADTGLVDSVVRPVMLRLCDGGLISEAAPGSRARSALRYQVRRTQLREGVLSASAALA